MLGKMLVERPCRALPMVLSFSVSTSREGQPYTHGLTAGVLSAAAKGTRVRGGGWYMNSTPMTRCIRATILPAQPDVQKLEHPHMGKYGAETPCATA